VLVLLKALVVTPSIHPALCCSHAQVIKCDQFEEQLEAMVKSYNS
jgi:hypothetical protein